MGIVSYSLLCADRIITENNGKKGIIGVFSGFQFPSFPSPPTHWFIYAGLANLGAKQDFSLNLVHEESQHVLFSLGGELNAGSQSGFSEIGRSRAHVEHRRYAGGITRAAGGGRAASAEQQLTV
jgi:hypothetical protein